MVSLSKIFICTVLTGVLSVGVAHAALPGNYPATFSELAGLIDSETMGPMEMVRGGWLATGYFATAANGLAFNQSRFAESRTPGEAGISGLFLAVHGTPTHHQFVCKALETNSLKRKWMRGVVGTEAAFFRSLDECEYLTPLMNALPAKSGVRALLKRFRQSPDALVRRAGLFFGYWFADVEYWQSVRNIALKDADAINRVCAVRLARRT